MCKMGLTLQYGAVWTKRADGKNEHILESEIGISEWKLPCRKSVNCTNFIAIVCPEKGTMQPR